MCTVHKHYTFQMVHQKCVLCAETEHFSDGNQKRVLYKGTEHFPEVTSEVCTVHRNRTLIRRYMIKVFCAQKQNCKRKPLLTGHKITFRNETQRFTIIHYIPTYVLNTNYRSYLSYTQEVQAYMCLSVYVMYICWCYEWWRTECK